MCSFSGTTRCGLFAALAAALLGSAACNDAELSTAPSGPESSRFLISDGANGGANPHFFFLPPVQVNPSGAP